MIAVQAESGSDRLPTRSGGPGADLAQQVADAVTAVDGVTGLHGGMFGEIATYLPAAGSAVCNSTTTAAECT